jgi:hypothetical protein
VIAEDERSAPSPEPSNVSPSPRAGPRAPGAWSRRIADHAPAASAYVALALMIVWAAHDGGYDLDTWYWGALALLAVSVTVGWATRSGPLRASVRWALGLLGAYVAFSYASIAWAASPGDALTGSDRALLYLLVFAAFARVAWRERQALAVLTVYALAVGAVGVVTLLHMTDATGASGLFSEGRLITPTGYFNSNAALFTAAALLSVALAARRELPALVRGLLLGLACTGLDLALLAQSRGWLFTLPAVLVVAILVSRDRLRVMSFALVAAAGALIATPALLAVYRTLTESGHAPGASVAHAATVALGLSAAVLVAGIGLAFADARSTRARLGLGGRRLVGTAAVVVLLSAGAAGALALSHGHPARFASTQWRGFTHPGLDASSTASHFTDVGSGRYDAWRVAANALGAHPLGGLGQDNFSELYVRQRHTGEELQWTHSLELRLLAHTGLIGTALFLAFIVFALRAALGGDLRTFGTRAGVRGAALLPFAVWLVHGSVDWFWEVPALSGPALGFLALAAGMAPGRAGDCAAEPADAQARPPHAPPPASPLHRVPRALRAGALAVGAVAALVALGLPYLSVREVSIAGDLTASNPAGALQALDTAARLNPLSADPGRVAGTIALREGFYAVAERRFAQAIARDPGGWYAWFGAGLAASALHQRRLAQGDLAVAAAINDRQPAILDARHAAASRHPLAPGRALDELLVAH